MLYTEFGIYKVVVVLIVGDVVWRVAGGVSSVQLAAARAPNEGGKESPRVYGESIIGLIYLIE